MQQLLIQLIKHYILFSFYLLSLFDFFLKNKVTTIATITTAKAIIKFQPDLVLSVDAYDFCIRVAKKVRKIQNKTQINDKNTKFKPITFWHIVAPSVWAYFSGRAKTLAKYYNHLFYLLPFERKYFAPFENKRKNWY